MSLMRLEAVVQLINMHAEVFVAQERRGRQSDPYEVLGRDIEGGPPSCNHPRSIRSLAFRCICGESHARTSTPQKKRPHFKVHDIRMMVLLSVR